MRFAGDRVRRERSQVHGRSARGRRGESQFSVAIDRYRFAPMTLRIYTRTGDQGTTGLFGGGRVDKHHPRVEAYGDVDELNAALGLARSIDMMPRIDEVLVPVQRDLFAIGALL